MRIFLICLSLIYVLGVSYTQRFSLGGQSCAQAGSGWSIDSSQIGTFSQLDNQVAFASGNEQRQIGSTLDIAGVQKHAELGHVGVTRTGIDPC